MDTEKLIKFVRQNRILYDTTVPHYLDAKKKIDTWVEIGQELGCDGMLCRSRWNNIRDQYRKSLKNSTTTKFGKHKRYRYSKLLAFLRPYLRERVSTYNAMSQNNDSTSEVPELVDLDDEDTLEDEDSQDPLTNSFAIDQASSEISHMEFYSPSPSSEANIEKPKSTAVAFMESQLKQELKVDNAKEHPIDKFLEGIAPTLKSLTPYQQNLAKSDIFKIVQKYELQMFELNMGVKVETDI